MRPQKCLTILCSHHQWTLTTCRTGGKRFVNASLYQQLKSRSEHLACWKKPTFVEIKLISLACDWWPLSSTEDLPLSCFPFYDANSSLTLFCSLRIPTILLSSPNATTEKYDTGHFQNAGLHPKLRTLLCLGPTHRRPRQLLELPHSGCSCPKEWSLSAPSSLPAISDLSVNSVTPS